MNTINHSKRINKLDNPPALSNWVRFVVENDINKTAKNITSFAKSLPPFSYTTANTAIKDMLQLGIKLEDALKIAMTKGSAAGRIQNQTLVQAFYKYNEQRKYPVGSFIETGKEFFHINKELRVPVFPLTVLIEKAQYLPIFLCGWSQLTLTTYQRRLFMTVCEDAFFSLTDFQNVKAEFLFFPNVSNGTIKKRGSEIWHRGDYLPLSSAELGDALETYLLARELARQTLLNEMANDVKNQEQEKKDSPSDFPMSDLFDFLK